MTEANDTTTRGPLSGIRVADFSRVLAGPHATMILADFGADVIKIESPEGDGTRQWSPPVNAVGQSTYFAGVNRGKRSVVCDLRSEEGQALARSLASTADVVIENFKPGTMDKFGLGYDAVAADNPGVVYCSISGFGDAAGRDLPGYDLLVQAVGGLMSITGQSDADGGEPTKVGVALVDILTGLNSVIGIQAALRARDTAESPTAGRGQHVKVTLLGSLLSALANQASSTLETGRAPGRMGNAHPSIAPYETFAAADQEVALAVGTDGQFARLCEVLGAPELASDPRFVGNPSRVAHRLELKALLEERLAARNAGEWIELFTAANIPAGRVNTIAQALDLAESLGLEPVAETRAQGEDGTERVLRSVATPISFSATPSRYSAPPPGLGEHAGAEWLPR
ncbi:carnitine dehydratase [Leucobacter sp. OLJS4]|uniref:CaiB/BaiF CoA transferase family protein n=1 Tax=unclassified Leucobacter TaxID=2621730 RepID=UPI000C17FBDE|nr:MULTISPECIES: CoA transferase [unclassified Leucobacter]PII83710.1 carnitine dehydratase [Leucobacter sp. OLCALW19]PII90761.1 carnitine dehydratase [Leucobacter sp. OLAS13]PII97803.1 carnitine dehydratase [Leucobacter sp. OLCS4]PIJ04731.1 carnitine dehydratase [Leucobacter sp. OLIS6]PIJ10088.1 carnitine dehydratase [Leucobacter sp. OLJS4]